MTPTGGGKKHAAATRTFDLIEAIEFLDFTDPVDFLDRVDLILALEDSRIGSTTLESVVKVRIVSIHFCAFPDDDLNYKYIKKLDGKSEIIRYQ